MENSNAKAGALTKSKQKSCYSCVQSKRRCDRRAPTCSRCAKQRLDCTYGKVTSRNSGPDDDSSMPPSTTPPPAALVSQSPPLSFMLDPMRLDPQLAFALTVDASRGIESLDAGIIDDPSVGSLFPELIDRNMTLPREQWLVQVGEQGLQNSEPAGSTAEEELVRDCSDQAVYIVGALAANLTQQL